MFAEIITIGDELLIGQVVDTNSAWMGQELNKIGIEAQDGYSLWHLGSSVTGKKKSWKRLIMRWKG